MALSDAINLFLKTYHHDVCFEIEEQTNTPIKRDKEESAVVPNMSALEGDEEVTEAKGLLDFQYYQHK